METVFNTSVIGSVDYRQTDQDFSTIRGAATGTALNSGASPHIQSAGTTNKWNELRRHFILFDTSSLTADATISAATLTLAVSAKSDVFSQNIDIITTTPASTTAIVEADYDQVGTTLQATSISIADISVGNNVFTLNANGLASISKTSITKFGARLSCDTSNTAPTWASDTSASITISSATLTVTYTLPFIPKVFLFI